MDCYHDHCAYNLSFKCTLDELPTINHFGMCDNYARAGRAKETNPLRCKYKYCAFNLDDKCVMDALPAIDDRGRCETCVVVELNEDFFETADPYE